MHLEYFMILRARLFQSETKKVHLAFLKSVDLVALHVK